MPRRSFSPGSSGDEGLVRQLPALLRLHRPDLMAGEKLYRSPPGFTSWSGHWAKAVAVELALEQSESRRSAAPRGLASPCPLLTC